MGREALVKNLATASKVAAGVTATAKAGKSAYDWWVGHRAYTVTVRSNDPIYHDVHEWLLTLIPGERKRALLALSDGGKMMPDGSEADPRLLLCFDDTRSQTLNIEGHRVRVYLAKSGSPAGGGPSGQAPMGDRPVTEQEIRFTTATTDGQAAVTEHLHRIVAERAKDRKPRLRIVDKWGDWCRRQDLPLRSLDSVVLRDGQKERIVADLDQFLKAEEDYTARAIPYHRGYLFDGPPGTGKTSLARALADHFRMDLWYLPLGDLTKDANLLQLLSQVNPRSIVLLEDIDVYHATQARDGEEAADGGLSLAGLLNALDGAATPHGLISILTTNNASVLDAALVRAGRIDCNEHINLPDADQASRLFHVFYGRPPHRPISVDGRSTADLSEVFKRHMHDPEAAEAELVLRRAKAAA